MHHDMNAHTRQMRDNASELRDQIADFDDFWRPLRSFTYWGAIAHLLSAGQYAPLLNSMDSDRQAHRDLANLTDDTERMDCHTATTYSLTGPDRHHANRPKLLAQALTSAFSGLVTQSGRH